MSMAYSRTNGTGSGSGFGNSSVVSPSHSGHHLADGHTTPVENGYHQALEAHNDKIVSHIFDVGFRGGNYSDIVVHVFNHQYRLHSLILSRSPYLAHLMSTTSTQNNIYIPLQTEPHITEEAINIAIGWLYSYHVLKDLQPRNARAILAAGCLLGGMQDLCDHAYQMCRSSISVESIEEWIEFLESIPPSDDISSPTPDASTSVFGPYAQLLRQDVFDFLVVALPAHLDAFTVLPPPTSSPPQVSGLDALLHIYSRVPFDIFRRAVESPAFLIGSDQARFRFAKAAIAMRKQTPAGRDAEETVVLAFGGVGDSASAVHITRKLKTRKRQLWKVTK